MLKSLFVALAALVVVALAAVAPPAAAQSLKPEDRALIPMAERVLQRIEVMTADFVFSNVNGANTGRLFVDRAGGRLRMEFDPPMNHLIIANGPRVNYFGGDGTELKVGTQTTPLALIFGARSKLTGDEVEVVETASKGKRAMVVS